MNNCHLEGIFVGLSSGHASLLLLPISCESFVLDAILALCFCLL